MVYAGAAEFEDFSAQRFEWGEIEELLAVVAEVALGAIAGLHAVGADELVGGGVVDHEVVADQIEGVAVEAGAVGVEEAFAEFAVEDEVAEALAGLEILDRLREGETEQTASRRSGSRSLPAVRRWWA